MGVIALNSKQNGFQIEEKYTSVTGERSIQVCFFSLHWIFWRDFIQKLNLDKAYLYKRIKIN